MIIQMKPDKILLGVIQCTVISPKTECIIGNNVLYVCISTSHKYETGFS